MDSRSKSMKKRLLTIGIGALALLNLYTLQAGIFDDIGKGFEDAGKWVEGAAKDVAHEVEKPFVAVADLWEAKKEAGRNLIAGAESLSKAPGELKKSVKPLSQMPIQLDEGAKEIRKAIGGIHASRAKVRKQKAAFAKKQQQLKDMGMSTLYNNVTSALTALDSAMTILADTNPQGLCAFEAIKTKKIASPKKPARPRIPIPPKKPVIKHAGDIIKLQQYQRKMVTYQQKLAAYKKKYGPIRPRKRKKRGTSKPVPPRGRGRAIYPKQGILCHYLKTATESVTYTKHKIGIINSQISTLSKKINRRTGCIGCKNCTLPQRMRAIGNTLK